MSLSASIKIKYGEKDYTNIVQKYKKRKKGHEKNLSLNEFFHQEKNNNTTGKTYIPHYVGGSSQPKYPNTEGYVRSILLINKPWCAKNKLDNKDDTWTSQFEAFLKEQNCPRSVKVA